MKYEFSIRKDLDVFLYNNCLRKAHIIVKSGTGKMLRILNEGEVHFP